MTSLRSVALAALLATTPAMAVGLGPLVKDGIVDGPDEAFYLTLFNPYRGNVDFVAYAVGLEDEEKQARVSIHPSTAMLPGERTRTLLVIAHGLEVGERYAFRVCAQRRTPPEGISINARVCSKISARRIG